MTSQAPSPQIQLVRRRIVRVARIQTGAVRRGQLEAQGFGDLLGEPALQVEQRGGRFIVGSSPHRHAVGTDELDRDAMARPTGYFRSRDVPSSTPRPAHHSSTPLAVGRGAHDICVSEWAGKAYITAEEDHAVTAVDIDTLERESIPVSPLPHHIEPSHDGRFVYVTLASHTTTTGSPQYAVIDTSDHSVNYVTTSRNPAARSHAVYPTPDGTTVYVAHDVGNEVTGVTTATEDIFFSTADTVSPPQLIPRAEEVIATRFGNRLWVAARGDGTVKRVDLETGAVAPVTVGVQPESVMLTPNERTLAVSSRGTPATVAFVDTVAGTLVATVPIGGAGTFGDLAVMSHDGRYVYATFDRGATGVGGVSVVDVRTQSVVAVWPYPGVGRPHGIWYSRKTRP